MQSLDFKKHSNARADDAGDPKPISLPAPDHETSPIEKDIYVEHPELMLLD